MMTKHQFKIRPRPIFKVAHADEKILDFYRWSAYLDRREKSRLNEGFFKNPEVAWLQRRGWSTKIFF